MVHAGTARSGFDETCEAIFMTSGFVYGTAEEAKRPSPMTGPGSSIRFRNPTVSMFEDRLPLTKARSAVSPPPAAWRRCCGSDEPVETGDRIVAPHALFGSCLHIVKNLAPQFGIETTLVNGTDADEWRAALSRSANIVFLETPSNPMLDVVDLALVSELAHAAGARVVVDNVFATRRSSARWEFSVDVVVYSATKHIDGQGRSLGGAILCDNKFAETLAPFLRHTGPALNPFNAWLLLKGLETMDLRIAAQVQSAQQVAPEFLEGHGKIAKTLYPGLKSHPQYELAQRQMSGSTLVAFDVAGGKAEAFRLMNGLRIIRISNNLGDSKSLITHPDQHPPAPERCR